jgi:hypothetical protein
MMRSPFPSDIIIGGDFLRIIDALCVGWIRVEFPRVGERDASVLRIDGDNFGVREFRAIDINQNCADARADF